MSILILNCAEGKQNNRQRAKQWRPLAFLTTVIIVMFVCIACAKDTPEKSTVDGVSDEVYEQLIQHYFIAKMNFEVITGEASEEIRRDSSWMTDHELYDEAEIYAEENDMHPLDAFPNPLYLEYTDDPGQFTETEQKYIEKMLEFMQASSRVKNDEYESLKEQLIEDLEIKDSYNMFDKTE